MSESTSLWQRVRSRPRLWNAWRHVYSSGIRSQSKETRDGVKAFNEGAPRHLDRIERQLRQGRFEFKPARGIAQRRPGKSPRPIVQAPVENRIVQRVILDVIQDEPTIASVIENGNSFGGIRERGVRQALEAAYESMQAGATYYIRSDIKQFFTKIPKSRVFSRLEEFIEDERFLGLVKEAMTVELENLAGLGEHGQLFPLDDEGVAQGSSLSPLAGNLLLGEFDYQMSGRGITCLRYIDDFLLLGASERSVVRAFRSAQHHLKDLGLDVYDPQVRQL